MENTDRAKTVQPWLIKQKSHEIFRSTASTVDIPTGWEPRRNLAVRALRVAFADFSAAPWQGFEKSERGPNNSSLFQPLAAVVVVAVQVLFRTEKRKTSTHCVLVFLGAAKQSKSEPFPFDAAWAASSNVMVCVPSL